MRIYLISIIVITIIFHGLHCMDSIEEAKYKTAKHIAQLAFKIKTDLLGAYPEVCFNFHSSENRVTWFGDKHDSFYAGFDFKDWKNHNWEGFKELCHVWTIRRIYGSELRRQFPTAQTTLIDIIKTLKPESKKLLLEQLVHYEISHLKMFAYLTPLIVVLCGAGTSFYTGALSEVITKKIGFIGLGVSGFLLGVGYGLKIVKPILRNYLWWNRCPNFQQASQICRKK